MKLFGGIDPGKSGAIAFIDGSQSNVEIFDFGEKAFRKIEEKAILYDLRIIIELQNPRPGNSAQSTFSMGGNYRDWLRVMKIFRVAYDVEAPAVWQRAVFDAATRPKKTKCRIPYSADSKRVTRLREKHKREHKKKLKQASIQRAKNLYPACSHLFTRHDRAEALLIAHFCWLRYAKSAEKIR